MERVDAYERLVEGLPPRASVPRAARNAPRVVGDAISSLPLANPALAAPRVDGLLDEMLGAAWSGSARIATLGSLDGPVAALCRGVWRALSRAAHPFAEPDAGRATFARRLHWKLARNHAVGVYELCAPTGEPPMLRRKLVTAAIVAALTHAGRALVWSYRQYRAPDAGVWRLLHALYAFAVKVGVAEHVPPDTRRVAGRPVSARDAYVQALLLALANPYRFAAAELADAIGVLACIAPHCPIGRVVAGGVPVDTNADDVPAGSVEGRAVSGPDCMMVDVRRVLQVIERRIAAVPAEGCRVALPVGPGQPVVDAPIGFLHRLGAGWTATARGHARLAASHSLDLVGGMRGLHYALAENSGFEAFVRQVERDAGKPDRGTPRSGTPSRRDSAEPWTVRADVLDQSEGGYRLRVKEPGAARLGVGALVGFAVPVEGVDERGWMVGVIRWMYREADALRLGVELLARVARAAGVRPVSGAGAALAPQRAVELPGSGEHDGLSLLLNHRLAHDIDTVELALPPLASEWGARATVDTWRCRAVEALGAACVRMTLTRVSGA